MRVTLTREEAILLMRYCEVNDMPYYLMSWDNDGQDGIIFVEVKTVMDRSKMHVVLQNGNNNCSPRERERFNQGTYKQFLKYIRKEKLNEQSHRSSRHTNFQRKTNGS